MELAVRSRLLPPAGRSRLNSGGDDDRARRCDLTPSLCLCRLICKLKHIHGWILLSPIRGGTHAAVPIIATIHWRLSFPVHNPDDEKLTD
uniref:Uncharacterized protein n=1 Tax=Oryza sativa subsp. japonica TaxID=39947 RepID=Q6YWK4_ORYSJ|nr:hypothetical protein [Oryza sativa Japonica Group]